jgi:hypothetical protein
MQHLLENSLIPARKPAMAKKKKRTTKKKKTAKKKAATLNDFYNQVASKADTQGVQINAAQTKRVLACFFDVLEDYKAADAFNLVAAGLKRSSSRRR